MSAICKKEYTVNLLTERSGLAEVLWTRKFIGIDGVGDVIIGNWDQVVRVSVNFVDLKINNLDDIDAFIPTCCPTGGNTLTGFKTWLYWWLTNRAQKIIEKEMAIVLSRTGDDLKPSFLLNASTQLSTTPDAYYRSKYHIPSNTAKVTVPVTFTVTTKENCNGKCECTIECNSYRDIIKDISNSPITPLEERPAGQRPGLDIPKFHDPYLRLNADFKQSLDETTIT
jgi:hypothetical protein